MVKKTSPWQPKSSKKVKPTDEKSVSKCLKVSNQLGLHARAAALFVKTANRYSADVLIQKGQKKVNGKSIMGLLTLAAGRGSEIVVTTSGEDSEEAMNSILELVESKFGEG